MDNRIIKIALLVVALLAVAGTWFWFRNTYSKEVLKLEILGPSETEAGSEVTYTVRYKNNGNIRLEDPKLIFDYPDNSIISSYWLETDDNRITVRGDKKIEIALNDIQPGEERSEDFDAVIFGIDSATIRATATLEYKPRNLNVRYESETSHTLKISGVPLTFEIHLPSRVEPGTEFSFDVNYFSRMDYPLTDLMVQIDYPSEFRFINSRPRPSFENSEWEIGVLNKGQGGRIEVSGILQDSSLRAKTFEATLGFWQNGRFIPLKRSVRGVELAAPPIFITHRVNEKSNYSANQGEYLYYQISFLNMGDDLLENLFLTVKLDESVIDFNNVQSGSGNFQRNAGMIIWDSNEVSGLRFLPTMEEGRVDFWVRVKDKIEGTNPVIRADVSLNNVNERIITKINSETSLVQRGYFEEGPFDNYGPQPPSVGSSTSYTIRWQVNNRHNNLEDAKVRATLAPGTRLSGDISPEEAGISFDSVSREIIWDIGNISSGVGTEVFFQIVFDPQDDQIGDELDIISEARFSARDTWTNAIISATYRAISTTLPDDPSVDYGIVQ